MPITEEQVRSTLSADLSCEQVFSWFEDMDMDDMHVGEYRLPYAAASRQHRSSYRSPTFPAAL
jgi:hypothetical protein